MCIFKFNSASKNTEDHSWYNWEISMGMFVVRLVSLFNPGSSFNVPTFGKACYKVGHSLIHYTLFTKGLHHKYVFSLW